METEHVDVLVVGAGISGIGAGYRLQTECPQKRFVILEGRHEIGGTWSLFRYPGIRSDSDMYTLGYPFRPWRGRQSIADGASILQYVKDTAAEYGIDRKIRFDHKVTHATWKRSPAGSGSSVPKRVCAKTSATGAGIGDTPVFSAVTMTAERMIEVSTPTPIAFRYCLPLKLCHFIEVLQDPW